MTVEFAKKTWIDVINGEEVETAILEELHEKCVSDIKFRREVQGPVFSRKEFLGILRRTIRNNEHKALRA